MTNKKKIFITLIIFFLFVGAFFFSLRFKKETKQENSKGENLSLASENENAKNDSILAEENISGLDWLAEYCNFFPQRRRKDYSPQFNGKSAIAVFFDHQGRGRILYDKTPEKKLPIASLTKMMTAIVTIDNYDLKKSVKVSQKAVATLEETGKLRVGEKISIGGLLDLALIVSSNDAATALAEVMGEKKFIEKMNEKADEIGLKNTSFANPHGLDHKNNYSTAKDLAILTQYALSHYPRIWEALGSTQKIIKGEDHLGREITHWANNTNQMLSENYVLGGKTGYTHDAGDAMILAMEAPGVVDGNVVMVLLGLGIAERIPKTKNLYDWVMWGWNWGDF